MALNDFQNMERSTGFFNQFSAMHLTVILPFFFRNFLLLLFLSKTNEMGGERGKIVPFCFFRQALTKLTDGVFKFFSHSSPCGHVINGGIMALVWSGVDGGWEGRGCTGSE